MDKEPGNLRVARLLVAAVSRIVVLSVPLLGVGCLILPVPSLSPCYETGILDETALESLAGLGQSEVTGRMGTPDYLGPRGDSYLMVYQGEKQYSTDIIVAVGGGYSATVVPIEGDCGSTRVLYCYVIELDEYRVVQDHDLIARSPVAITKPDSSENTVDPIANCSEAVWQPHEREQVLTKIEAEREARIAELEPQAQQGDVEATIALAEISGDLAPLRALAENGNPTAAYALYEQLSRQTGAVADAWKWLCKSANESIGAAQAEVGYWQRTSVWNLSGDDRISSLENIGIKPDNRVAYMWYTLADSNGDPTADAQRDYIVADMNPALIAQAERMVRDWKPGDCPSMEYRLTSPSGT